MTYADECIQLEKWRRKQLEEIKKIYPETHGLDGEINAAERKMMETYKTRMKEILVKYPNGPTEEDKKRIHEYFQDSK